MENLTILLNERIDADTAQENEELINKERSAKAHDALTLDARNLKYISSAGLRVILKIKKEEENLKIINVESSVYEIFEMTGFAEMIDIEKAYRHLTIDGAELIGKGANGTVYRINKDTIIKVYHDNDALPYIKNERELAKKAFVKGIPTAIPYDIVMVGDKYGSVFELLDTDSFAKVLSKDPSMLDTLTEESVKILKKLHSTIVDKSEFPSSKDVVCEVVSDIKEVLPEKTHEKLSKMVNDIPEQFNLLHGDYHFKNIMYMKNESLIIDMDTLCYGNPIFEFAFIFNANKGYGDYNPDTITNFLGFDYNLSVKIWEKTVDLYLEGKNEKFKEDFKNKCAIIGYSRILRRLNRIHKKENVDNLDEQKFYIDAICDLVDKVDNLAY